MAINKPFKANCHILKKILDEYNGVKCINIGNMYNQNYAFHSLNNFVMEILLLFLNSI